MVDVLAEVAERRGQKPAVTALAWILSKAGVVAPIVGAYKPNHLEDAVKAVETKLAPEDIVALEAPYAPQGVIGHV